MTGSQGYGKHVLLAWPRLPCMSPQAAVENLVMEGKSHLRQSMSLGLKETHSSDFPGFSFFGTFTPKEEVLCLLKLFQNRPPPDWPLWPVDCFQLKATETLWADEKLVPLP